MQKTGCIALWGDAFGAGVVAVPERCGAGRESGDVGAGGRRSLGRCTPAKQNCNSAQGFHQVFFLQLSRLEAAVTGASFGSAGFEARV